MEALLNRNRILDFDPNQSSVFLERETDDNSNFMWSSINIFHFPKFWENSLIIQADNILHRISLTAVRQIAKVSSFANLKENWDSYGAVVPKDIAISNANDFIYQMDSIGLHPYFVAPGKNGEVMIEFKNENRAAEIYFNPDGTNELLLFTNNEVIFEGSIEQSRDRLFEFIN